MGKIRTFLRHAFGFRTLAPISVSGLSGYMGVSNMQLLMDDPFAVVTVALFLVAGLVAWATVGYDGYRAEQRDNLIEGMSLDIKNIASKLPLQPIETPASLQNLTTISAEQLRQEVYKLVSRMRDFGNDVKSRNMQAILNFHSHPHANEEKQHIAWEADTNHYLLANAASSSEFNSVYRSDALAYRQEMRRRLGIIDTQNYDDVALDHGMLAGVNPIDDAALSLETLARKLF